MRRSRRPVPTSRDEWEDAVRRWRASGRSLRGFAIAEGIPIHRFRYWQGRIERSQSGQKPGVSRSILPVTVLADRTARGMEAGQIEVRLPSGVSVVVSPGFEATDLLRVMEVVR